MENAARYVSRGAALSVSAENGVHELLGVEGLEVVQLLAEADVVHRQAQLIADGDGDAALGGAVQLGEYDALDVGHFLEEHGLLQAVLPGGGVDDQQGLDLGLGILAFGHADILIVDTAGRLHNKAHLMEELKKISRVAEREYPEARVKALLVIDATTGQNGLQQALLFKEVANIEGIVLTKLDGTAKGGIAVAIRNELGLPVYYIGFGEQLDDLQPFDARQFVDAIFG